MELKDLKDFYEKQEYYDYTETPGHSAKDFNKRVKELTFFVNIAVFSVLLALITYLFISLIASWIAVPIAFVLALVLYISLKRGIARAIKLLMK